MAVRVDVRDLDQAIADGFVRQLGAGSYGSVWYWRSAVEQREMAVKKVNKADARRKQVASGGTLDPIEQARTEALVMRSLSHPNIVSVYDFVETPDALYLMLEYCPGGDLLALLNRVGRLDEPTAAVYFRQLVDAVTYIHRSGFVHRDIKCENIFFGVAYNQILLGDFGFSGRWTPGKKLPQSWGSLHYASPEIAQGLPYEGPEVDMWSCGVVLYAMTMAALPFNGPTEADIVDQISVGEYPPLTADLSPAARDLIPQLLHVEATRRPAAATLLSHPFLIHASLPRVHSDPSSHDSPAASMPSSRRASVALSRLPSFYEDTAGPQSARNAAIASARTVAQQMLERQLSSASLRLKSRRPSVADVVGGPPSARGAAAPGSRPGSRVNREVSAAALAAALEGPKVISRKGSLGDVANSVPPSPRLTNFPLREPETPRPTLSRLSSLRNLTKQKELARQAEKRAKDAEEKRAEDERAARRKEKQERADKRRKDKERATNNATPSPAIPSAVSSLQWNVEIPANMSEEEKLLWAIQMEEPHRDELANKYLDLIHRLLTDPNLSIQRLPRRRVTVRPNVATPSASGATSGTPVVATAPTPQSVPNQPTAQTPAPGAARVITGNLNDFFVVANESRLVRRGPWPATDDENNPLETARNPLLASPSLNKRANALISRLSATLPRHFANRVSAFLAACLAALQPHLQSDALFKPPSSTGSLFELRTQGEISPQMLNALSPQHLTSLILHSLQEGKPFLSQAAQSRLLSLVGQDNSLDGVRDMLRLLPVSNRSVAYVVMTMMQAIERHSDRNKMTASALAQVLTPVIMRSPSAAPAPAASRVSRPSPTPQSQAVELLIRTNVDDLIKRKKLLRLSTALTPFLLTQSSSDSSPTGSAIISASVRDEPSPPASVKGFNARAAEQSHTSSGAASSGASSTTGETTSPRRSVAPRGTVQAVKAATLLVREGGTIFKVFKQRYCVLTKLGELEVFKDNADYVAMNSRIGAVEVASSDISPQESTLGETHLWVFSLSQKGKSKAEPLDFACETEADRFSWIIELLKCRSVGMLTATLDAPDSNQIFTQLCSMALAEQMVTREDVRTQTERWGNIPKLLQYLENASSSPNEIFRDAAQAVFTKVSSVEDMRPLLAPHLPLLVRGVSTGADRVKDYSLQTLSNLAADATCRGAFRASGVVPALVTTLASEKTTEYMRESAALALSVASTDPAIQNLLRSSVLLFSSVFAAALEQDNFRLRALIVDLMANCAKNDELWRLLIQSGVYTALLAAAKEESIEIPPPSPVPPQALQSPAQAAANAQPAQTKDSNVSGGQLSPGSQTMDAADRQRAIAIVKALQIALRNKITRSPRENEGAPSLSEIRRPSGHSLPVRPDEATRFLFGKLCKGEEREDDASIMAATDFLANYASPSFTHSSLLRAIMVELPPRKSAFSESMIGALRLLRLWVLTHFVRDFWRARLEGKFPGCMFGKMRQLLKSTERRFPTLQFECNRVKLAILRKHAQIGKAESSPRGSSMTTNGAPLRRVSSKHNELMSSRVFRQSSEDAAKEEAKKEKLEKEIREKGSALGAQTPGRTSRGGVESDKKKGDLLSPRKKP